MSDSDDVNLDLLKTAGHTGYRTVLADPPWPSRSSPGKRSHWMKTNMKPRYGTMKARDILDMPVNLVAAEDAILIMWATWMHLGLAMDTIEAWGFTYCSGFPWLKVIKTFDLVGKGYDTSKVIPQPIFGPGVWFQGCTELILIGRRGHPFGSQGNPRPARKGLIVAPRQEHSAKPEELRRWIDDKFPGPKIELFARKGYPGWTSWGNEL